MRHDFNQVIHIARKFGGLHQLADAIGVPYHQVRDWARRSKFIPEKHRPAVLAAGERLGVDVSPFDFIRHLVTLAA